MRTGLLAVAPLLALVTLVGPARAQTAQAERAATLRGAVLALDKALFDAFNACDLEGWKRYIAEDVEFYQDNDGVATSRAELEPSFEHRCGRDDGTALRRELLPETVEVHPIQGYGAVQLGTHRFWIVESGRPDRLAATPKFVHLWRNRDGLWQITRVISYGH